RIAIVDRDKETAATGSESEKGFTVQVTDPSGAPAGESAVVFRLPDEGAPGSFSDGARSAIVYTSADGRARVSKIQWSDAPGVVPIKVTATKGEARTGLLLVENLTAPVLSKATPVPPAVSRTSVAPVSKSAESARTGSSPVPSAGPPGQPASVSKTIELPKPSAPPVVSVVTTDPHEKVYSRGHKKWIILAAVVAAGAGAGLAIGGKSKTATQSSATTGGISVGSPSISVGHP
ncbi:MAG: hypothetical protein JWP08_4341, partial [Bryobacterales bacterium]|nr:hypothetical protein [Bryobacterales bacterium]